MSGPSISHKRWYLKLQRFHVLIASLIENKVPLTDYLHQDYYNKMNLDKISISPEKRLACGKRVHAFRTNKNKLQDNFRSCSNNNLY